ncbi:MAG TPA: glycosyltransferase family 39 protein, partial [Caldilineaceae bacterium]|nr:glycosyltransferase family 39 protein [Caldilineaceae bacterium]
MLARVEQVARRYPHSTALIGFGLLTLLFYAPIVLGLRTFPDGDFTHHFLPFSLFQQQALHNGALPLWNPYTYAGHPFLADTQAAVFYPLSNLLLLLSWPWTAAGPRLYFLQVEAILQVALAGFFVYLLVQELTRQRAAGFIAGCCFAFSGYLTGYPLLQLAVLRTAIWLPLLLWLLQRAFDEPQRWRWWLWAGVVAGVMIFAGHPQTWLYALYTVAAYSLLRLVYALRTPASPSHGMRAPGYAVAGLLASALVALGLAAAQLLPSLEFVGLSVRANVNYAFVSGGFPWQDSWQLLLPGVLTEYSPLYIGVVGLFLAIVGSGAWLAGRRRPSGTQPAPILQTP